MEGVARVDGRACEGIGGPIMVKMMRWGRGRRCIDFGFKPGPSADAPDFFSPLLMEGVNGGEGHPGRAWLHATSW